MNNAVTLSDIDVLLVKALQKIRKSDNQSEQNSGLGLVNRASKLAKVYASQIADEKAKARFDRMQNQRLIREQVQRTGAV